MRKLFFILGLAFLIPWGLMAQATNLDLNFDGGSTEFTAINSDGGNPSYTLSVNSGILNIVTAKRAEDWSFLGKFGILVNFSSLPTLQFRAKSTGNVNFIVRIKSPRLGEHTQWEQIEKSVALVGGADFQDFFFDLTSDIAGKPLFQPDSIEEIHVECTQGWMIGFTGTVELDHLKIGYPEPVSGGGTGYRETFDLGLPAGVTTSAEYGVSHHMSTMKVNVNKSSRWAKLDYELDGLYDLSASPILNIKARSEKDLVLQAFLVDELGKGYKVDLVGSQYKYYELNAASSYFKENRVLTGNQLIDMTFDFSGVGTKVDLTKIVKIIFCVNGTATTFDGTLYIDDIRLGDEASKIAYIGQVPDKSYYINSGSKTILIPEIRNVASLSAGGAAALVQNLSTDAITYTTGTENGRSVRYGYSRLHFDLISDASGNDTITITGTGETGYSNAIMKIPVVITNNANPTLDAIEDMIAAAGTTYQVSVEGISDGDPDDNQTLTITATSDNTGVCPNPTATYIQGYQNGSISFTPASAGTANITIEVSDGQGGTASESFAVTVYTSLNGVPTIDQAPKVDVYNSAGEQVITLTGISDGDPAAQNLTITATSSNTGIVPDPVVGYTQGGNTATLTFTPNAATNGLVTITVTVTDNGAAAGNNGNQSVVMTFDIESLIEPTWGYKVDLSDPDILSYLSPEGAGVTYFVSVIDTLGDKALRIEYRDKWTYGGIWFQLPEELNLSNTTALSYEVFSRNIETYHWNYLYHAHGADGGVDRNTQNTAAHTYAVAPGSFTNILFDYRQDGDMNNGQGEAIDKSRIAAVLFNMHNTQPTWPFTNTTAVVYYRNIRLGDSVSLPPVVPVATLDNVPDQAIYLSDGSKQITLNGISNGNNSTTGVTVTATSSNTGAIPNPVIGTINTDGTATLTFAPVTIGSSIITVRANAPGSTEKSITFKINVLSDDPAGFSIVTLDRSETHQTIRGLGTFTNEARWADLYATDLGASAMRLGIIGNQFEPVNDNDDPNILDMNAFNYDAFDWDYYRNLKVKGVEVFILTSWSPPAWMKRNLSEDHREQAIEWESTDNILEPYYYEEFAESMVAVVKAFKERCDIDILAVGLQNEPYFNEPYGSAILSGTKFAELIGVVGDRFAAEGLSHVGFYMPEQVFGLGWGDYSNEGYLASVRANPKADAYCDYFAVHGYDGTGVQSGFPSYTNWQNLRNLAHAEPNPKEMWMSETHIGYTDWTSALNLAGALHGSLWAGDITLWTNWGFGDMQMTKNAPNSSFYTSKNYFKFIRPGAVRITSSANAADILVSAFENTDGTTSVVLINKGTAPISTRITGNNLPQNFDVYRSSKYENCIPAGSINIVADALILPASSVTTLVSELNTDLTMNQVADLHVDENSGEHIVEITGISNGEGGITGLTLTADVSNSALFSAFDISAITASGTAEFTFTPATDATGSSIVTLTLTDGNTDRVVSFYIYVDPVTGKADILSQSLSVYPVPTRDQLNVKLDSRQFDRIAVKDLSGRTIYEAKVSTNLSQINTRSMAKGYYILEASGNKTVSVVRFVVE